ncbi:MAG: TatD family hydrolase [Thermodesulfobacteriota bacterium]
MFDSHVHFDAEPFFADLGEVAARTRAAGVTGAVNPAIDLASSARTKAIHEAQPWILPAAGFHPLYLDPWEEPPEAELDALLRAGAYVAIGEAGLDFWHGRDDEARQRAFLEAQGRLARRYGLPVLLHVRKGFYEALAVLRQAGFTGPGVCHAFSGTRDMARLALDRGFHLSACATITYPERSRLREVFRWAPRDRILVETDAPDIPPLARRGQVHRPWDLPLTVAALAEAMGVTPGEAAEVTEENARRLFGGERKLEPPRHEDTKNARPACL